VFAFGTARLLTALAAALAVAALEAGTAWGAPRPRPSDVPSHSVETSVAPNPFQLFNDYALPERLFPSRTAVVHYVAAGIDAPPLNDDDGDSVPDYVERVGEAADRAIAYYGRRGFAAIRPDTGGPDSRPDLYVSRFTPGVFGVAIPHGSAVGGSYAAIANNLDPSPERSFASLYGTVAHEVFHLVQFSYFRLSIAPDVPLWALEGTAAAMETRVYPELDDIVSTLQLRAWYAAPQRGLVAQTYGAQLFWGEVDRRFPRVLPAYLRRLGTRIHSGAGTAELQQVCARVTGHPLASTFHRFAVAAAREHAPDFARTRALGAGGRMTRHVAPLAIGLVRIRFPRAGSGRLVVSVQRRSPGLAATMTYRVPPTSPGDPAAVVRVAGHVRNGVLRFTLRVASLRKRAAYEPLLILTGGDATRAAAVTVLVTVR